ncbi:MAG: RsmB/NOP family class I SAM-dependent RNA methyltransferase [Acidobacteria bacterium]|nr:MAG: RsmB/NOP family class I SAM-dependent RNA methyltransferase [Acidobacteriota bacterium]
MTPLERYRDVVDDWPAFCAALARPQPPCVMTNRLRLTRRQLAAWLAREGMPASPIPWLADGLRLAPGSRPGRSVLQLTGLLNIQEEIAMLPAVLLDPQPGERILDLCAAPGNKTAQIAFLMGDRGTVVANDRFADRAGLVRRTVERLGLTSVAVTCWDGTSMPPEIGCFDRVMVDVPCSCEGTARKNPAILMRLQMRPPGWPRYGQRALLDKALQLCRPGGRVVYATCTFAPEENEQVVAEVLDRLGDAVRLLPADHPGINAAPGLVRWGGQRFPADLRHCRRLYPHHNDTGGFFVAVLEKLASTHRSEPPAEPAPLELEELAPEPYLAHLEEVYGLDRRLFAGHRLVRSSRERLALVRRHASFAARPAPVAAGCSLLHLGSAVPRLTTAATCAWGRHATRNVVELDAEQVDRFFTRQPLELRADQLRDCRHGYHVITRHQGHALGLGHFQSTAAGGILESSLPRRWYAERARARRAATALTGD